MDRIARDGFSLHERVDASRRARFVNPQDIKADQSDLLEQWDQRLERLGLSAPRMVALGIDPSAFRSFASASIPIDEWESDGTTIREFLEIVLSKGSPARRDMRRYPEGLPAVPPAIEHYTERILERAAAPALERGAAYFADSAKLLRDEISLVLAEIHDLLLPTLVVELHVASVRGRLQGETAEARFEYFAADLLSSDRWLSEYFSTYPLVVRLLITVVSARARAFEELLARFVADRSDLIARFAHAATTTTLEKLSPGLGDRHRGGRAVRTITFSNGVSVVYKPRPVAVDVAFQALLQWTNRKGLQPAMFVMSILQRDQYGWFEHVGADNCANENDISRFYTRHGAHIALLYLLGGYDFFHENVRAHGEYPVLVDLECVHAPRHPPYSFRLFESAGRRYLEESVYRAGLLPAWNWMHLGNSGVDLSALTIKEEQEIPIDATEWVGRGTDQLHQQRVKKLITLDYANLPKLNGVHVPVDGFMDELRTGFLRAYHLIHAHRNELLADSGPLASFEKAECRVVIRSTVDYHLMLREVSHPRYVRDALYASELLDRIWASHSPRYTAPTLESEIRQVWSRDVPLFTVQGSGRDLYDPRGLVHEAYFDESATEGTRRRLERWGTEDCTRQLEIMDCAFAAMSAPHVASGNHVGPRTRDQPGGALEHALVAEAAHIADRILDTAIEDDESLTWIGLGVNTAGQWDPRSLDSGLYDGGPGIAMLLLGVHALTGNERCGSAVAKIVGYACEDAARRVLAHRARLDDWILHPPSAFTFPFSAFYLTLQARNFGFAADLETVTDAMLEYAETGLNRPARHDYLNGGAGLIRMLNLAHRETGSDRALRLARRYGDRLLDNSVSLNGGIGWMSEQYPVPVGGFAHGASGVSWVLAELAALTSDDRFFDAAISALRFDRTLFSGSCAEWIDMRTGVPQPGKSVQWCHGVAGIGLGRALLSPFVVDGDLMTDVARAVDITLAADNNNDCLCHGTLGNLDCCLVAAAQLGRHEWTDRIQKRGLEIVEQAYERGYWRTGAASRQMGLPGLFMGTAGIGYGLLRLAAPDLLPSVLCFEGRPTSRSLTL